MAANWLKQVRQMPDSALIDIEHYAAEFNAIDASIRKSLEAHEQKPEMSPFGWGDPVVRDSMITGIIHRPIAPVATSDSARIAVALLYRLHLARSGFLRGDTADELGSLQILLAMADKLMKRKIKFSPEAGRDLARVVNVPAPGKWPVQLFEYLPHVLKQLERTFPPPVPEIMCAALKDLHSSLSRPIRRQSWERHKKSSVPKKYQNACLRIDRLLGKA